MDYSNSILQRVSIHSVGNKTNDDPLHLSTELLDVTDINVRELLFKFFLNPFNDPEYYTFTFSNEDFNLNPLFQFANKIFDNVNELHPVSIDIAKHLYDQSIHPQIKSGDLFVAYFANVEIEEGTADAIGIFKSENRQDFLKVNRENDAYSVQHQAGINVEKLDKGCLIFNVNKEEGYKVCIIDKSNKSSEAQYWKDDFLQIKPCSDDFHHTKAFMNITKNFVTKQLTEEFAVSKTDQIDFLNRSVDYFKTHESFDKEDFETTVFNNEEVIKSFRTFDDKYREEHDIEITDEFEISSKAVKKQSRIFKSVLKLDKNFHVYIHGDRKLIEQGVDSDGRKFYKLYFEEEA